MAGLILTRGMGEMGEIAVIDLISINHEHFWRLHNNIDTNERRPGFYNRGAYIIRLPQGLSEL